LAVVAAIGEQLLDPLLASGAAFILRLSAERIRPAPISSHQCPIHEVSALSRVIATLLNIHRHFAVMAASSGVSASA
jgi:hypothetical protein